MTDRLKSELDAMLREHKTIVNALRISGKASEKKKTEYAQFAEMLILHAQTEEEVLYPAAILTGEYLKLKLDGRLAMQAVRSPSFLLSDGVSRAAFGIKSWVGIGL